MSRRCKKDAVKELLRVMEEHTLHTPGDAPLVAILDGKPLPIGGCSKDKQAGYGRAAGCKAKGYKLHALVGCCGSVLGWRVAPMYKGDRVMAKRMLRSAGHQGYVLGDGNFDSNPLHKIFTEVGETQLVIPTTTKGRSGASQA